jgi:hypothetical protein
VKIADLTRANNISRKSKLKSGVRIVLPENAVFEDSKVAPKNSSSQRKRKNRRITSSKKKRIVASDRN